MPIAAVPKYLGSDFSSGSPGLRFNMYLKLWGVDSRSEQHLWTTHDVNYRKTGQDRSERRFEDENKTRALKAATTLNGFDRESVAAHVQRQRAIFDAVAGGEGLQLTARAVAPFTTGLGNEHPLENGFAFLNPYGLPYLPGSGVKGTIRRAAEELAHPDFFCDGSGWTLPAIWHLFGFEPWLAARRLDADWEQWIEGFPLTNEDIGAYLDAVLDSTDGSRNIKARVLQAPNSKHELLRERKLHVRGALDFWDVVPQVKGNKLAAEIMTPHHSHYYQQDAHAGRTSPHDSGKLNPITFLTVPPGSVFTFHARCDHRRLSRCAPELAEDGRWRGLLEAAFEHAFQWLGFGGKGAVGYGAMERGRVGEQQSDREHERHRGTKHSQIESERADTEAVTRENERIASLSPLERDIEAAIRDRQEKGMTAINAVIRAVLDGRWKDAEKIEVAKWLEAKMKAMKRWKETSERRNVRKDKDFQNTLLVKGWLEGK